MRPTYAEIDLTAIADNVSAIGELIAPSELCAVVKADGYGHGDVPVATTALEAGASCLAVALVEEAVRLREAGVNAPIIVLSEPPPDAVGEFLEWELTPTAYSIPFVEALGDLDAHLGIHVKVDTGMHRVGAAAETLPALVDAIESSPKLELAGLWTHFAVADEDAEYTKRQIERFDQAAEGMEVPVVHLANTAGAVLFPETRRDLCRIGLGIYGMHPCEATREHIHLRPAMRLVTHVSHARRLAAGERPSYGRRRELPAESTVVTAPVGYADGYSRGLSTAGVALIGGRRFPLAGTVTMDQIVIDVGDAQVGIGDEVVLLGTQGEETIEADDWASALDTISYEVVCSIGPRVPRRYPG